MNFGSSKKSIFGEFSGGKSCLQNPSGGWILMEVMLAMAIFSIAAVGFITALNRTADLSDLSRREIRISRILSAAISEAATLPTIEEGEYPYVLDEENIQITIKISQIKLNNKNQVILEDMWQIQAIARWRQGPQEREESMETWRYGKMYQAS